MLWCCCVRWRSGLAGEHSHHEDVSELFVIGAPSKRRNILWFSASPQQNPTAPRPTETRLPSRVISPPPSPHGRLHRSEYWRVCLKNHAGALSLPPVGLRQQGDIVQTRGNYDAQTFCNYTVAATRRLTRWCPWLRFGAVFARRFAYFMRLIALATSSLNPSRWPEYRQDRISQNLHGIHINIGLLLPCYFGGFMLAVLSVWFKHVLYHTNGC